MLKHLEERRQSEKGFTLIELMVVVLIMGILMAIAIPTFLSTRGSANDAAGKANATNAFTNEKAYYASNQQFLAATSMDAGGATLDNSLPWGLATTDAAVQGDVEADVTSTGTYTNNAMVIYALSRSGNCFYILDVETSSAAIIGYAATKGGCTSYTPTGSETINPGSSGVQDSGAPAWYASW